MTHIVDIRLNADASKVKESAAGAHEIHTVLAGLAEKFDDLLRSPRLNRLDHPHIPREPGVYLFSEQGMPVYVGRSRNLRQRLSQHGSGDRWTATFAFQIALQEAGSAGLDVSRKRKRADLEADPAFQQYFVEAKQRVGLMDVQFLQIDDAIFRAVFEIYAAVRLGTHREFNSFKEH